MNKREQQIEAARDNALTAALEDLLAFLDPDDDDCDVDPQVRREASLYLESWVAGPLAAALNRQELGTWAQGHSGRGRAAKYLALIRQ
jgi:hypothetical protein